MTAPKQVLDLVKRFDDHRENYISGTYNETQVRREFLDPFFGALGWDVNNKQGHAEAYKEVIHEDAIRVGGTIKAPDYCFRIGGVRKFFVEAKKPSVKIKEDIAPAYQLRRYAWTAGMPLGILTDFEEFAVYDTRVRPKKDDKASTARVIYMRFDEYEKRWEEIVNIFSKEAILKGSFDKYGETKKRGTAEVDKEFLKEIERWREELAKGFAIRNSNLSQRELNFAVQKTIDRIIFLRIAEDRGIEPYGTLQKLLDEKNLYSGLCEIFFKADKRYNSGLFHFNPEKNLKEEPDVLTCDLGLDDKVVRSIIKNLYYPESPYEFSVLPADILGHVYEQFLGKVIELTPSHRAKVVEKPEVRKAGGVYYTPTYIVDYIVKNTVGELVKGKTPKQVEKIKILDPACGSGSFLIGAYQYLLDWHRDWYMNDDPGKWSRGKNQTIYDAGGHDWRLTTDKKKKILLINIFGVDLDYQAAEVTKLSLLLKVLENEKQAELLSQRALPHLSDNIKCGNSLISDDYYTLDQGRDVSIDVNSFNWSESFPEVISSGGFHVIIGNPPYLPIFELDKSHLSYFSNYYKNYSKRYDAYGLFIEKGLNLLKSYGILGFITPSSLLNNSAFEKLRQDIYSRTSIKELRVLGGRVFRNVNKDTLIVILENDRDPKNQTKVSFYNATHSGFHRPNKSFEMTQSDLLFEGSFQLIDAGVAKLLNKIKKANTTPLSNLVTTFQGIVTGSDNVFIVHKAEVEQFSKTEKELIKPFLFGADISRYSDIESKNFLLYITKEVEIDECPNIKKRLNQEKEKLSRRREVKLGRMPWYALHWPRKSFIFKQDKILVQGIRNLSLKRRIVATLDKTGSYAGVNLAIINIGDESEYNLEYLLGVINSNVVNFLFRYLYVDHRIKNKYLDEIPIPHLDLSKAEDQKMYETIIGHVSQLLDISRINKQSRVEDEQMKNKKRAIEKAIDKVIYDFFRFSEGDIKRIEND